MTNALATKYGFTEVKAINGYHYERGDIMVQLDREGNGTYDVLRIIGPFHYRRIGTRRNRPRTFEGALIRAAALV